MSNQKQIPKARALYRGDINAAVIQVQKLTGVNINDGWWNAKVGNNGASEQILDRFDQAYEPFCRQELEKRAGSSN